MRFYELTPTKIIDLETVRSARLININEIWITFNCGSNQDENAVYKNRDEALLAYKALVRELYDM